MYVLSDRGVGLGTAGRGKTFRLTCRIEWTFSFFCSRREAVLADRALRGMQINCRSHRV